MSMSTPVQVTLKKWEMILLSCLIAVLPTVFQAVVQQAVSQGLIPTAIASIIVSGVHYIYLSFKSS